jgi:hypothetical protein
VLIDLHTEEGIVGRSYLEPYLERSMPTSFPLFATWGEERKGRPRHSRRNGSGLCIQYG